jgi:hypothetical protein
MTQQNLTYRSCFLLGQLDPDRSVDHLARHLPQADARIGHETPVGESITPEVGGTGENAARDPGTFERRPSVEAAVLEGTDSASGPDEHHLTVRHHHSLRLGEIIQTAYLDPHRANLITTAFASVKKSYE